MLPDKLMTEVKVLAARERRKLGEMMTDLVQAGIESRTRREPGDHSARRRASQAWLAKWERLSDELNAALPVGGSIVEEMIRGRSSTLWTARWRFWPPRWAPKAWLKKQS